MKVLKDKWLLLRVYIYTLKNLDSVLKSRDVTLPTKVCMVEAIVFSKSHEFKWVWTIQKAEHWRIDAFQLWCWRRLVRLLWTARRSNWSVIKEINPEYSLEGLMLKLKIRYLGHLIEKPTQWKRPWCWEGLRAGGEDGDRGWDGWMMSLLNGHEFEQNAAGSEGQESLGCCSPWGHKESNRT